MTWERTGRVKVRKLLSWDKGSLTGKAKALRTSKAKQGVYSLFPIGRQVFRLIQESKTPWVMVIWEDRQHNFEIPPPSTSFSHLLSWAQCHVIWDIPWVSWGRLSQLCFLPNLVHHSLLTEGAEWETEQTLALCTHWSATAKTAYVINTGLVTNPKHSTSWATMKKFNPNLTAKSSAEGHYSYSEEWWDFFSFLFFGVNFHQYDFLFLGWSYHRDVLSLSIPTVSW